ncbi:hypothetical protein ACB092_11G266400 [Castanea dentata]
MQAVNHLLAWGFGFVHVNHRNSEGKTAWDIFEGQTQDVKLLEHIDELTFVNTPLHIVASAGNIQFAMEMIFLKPSFARKLNQNGFSPIHIALQNGHIELVRRECLTPLHYVVESGEHLDLLKEFLSFCPDSIIDKDNEGNTVLNIAISKNQTKGDEFVDVNHKNLEDNSEIRVMLRHDKAKPASSLSTFNSHPNNQRLLDYPRHFVYVSTDIVRKSLEERRSMLLVVTILLATLSYQAVLTPPGGLWQDNDQCINTTVVGSSNGPVTTLVCEHKAETAIAFEDPLFILFLSFKFLFFGLNVTLCFCNCYTVWAITDEQYSWILLAIGPMWLCNCIVIHYDFSS